VTAPADSNSTSELAVDCRFFLGDRPCVWHKREGVTCRCGYYEAIGDRVLIVKLDAMGDVLRTTSLLPVIAAQHQAPRITWLTRPESLPLLENNPLIGQVIALGPDATLALLTREFDRVINMDAGQISAGLASLARSERKDGFVLHTKGFVQSTNPAAEAWLRLGVDDALKRQGTRTYQAWMTDICRRTRRHRATSSSCAPRKSRPAARTSSASASERIARSSDSTPAPAADGR